VDISKILNWLKIPGGIVAAVVALGIIITALGGKVHMPGDEMARVERHNAVQSDSIKANADSIVRLKDYLNEEQDYFENLNQYLMDKEIEDSLQEVEEARKDTSRTERTLLIEALVKGECLESMFEKLALQGLVGQCAELGVLRSHGDAIDRSLTGGN